jgi:hypothetical protein
MTMRKPILTLFMIALAASALPARDTSEDARPVRRTTDGDRRARLQEYLAAFRHLSPTAQARIRQLDADLRDEDAETRTRLFGVMERYALWLSRLSGADRSRVEVAPAGKERLDIVRSIVEQQWLDNLPPTRKEMLANATDPERATLLERWHKEAQARQQDRAWALRSLQERMLPDQAEKRKRFLDDVDKFVQDKLNPKLSTKQRQRLQTTSARGPGTYLYLHQVWMMSQNHNLTPPGPPEIWAMFREPRK